MRKQADYLGKSSLDSMWQAVIRECDVGVRTPDPRNTDHCKHGKYTLLNIKTVKQFCGHVSRVSYIMGGNIDLKDRNL